MYGRKDTYILGAEYQKMYTRLITKQEINRRWVFETSMVVDLKEKVGRKRRGCPGVMSGVSISVVELLQGLIQKEKVHIDCEKGAQISILANKIATQ